MSAPFFSVAMPAYNAERDVSRAIDSLLAQTFSDWELVIVDDGSTDRTSEIVTAYTEKDARIALVRQANAGCGAARDTAVRASCGRYIVRFDTDDALLPEYLETMHAFIEARPGFDIYSCNGWHVFADGSRRLARPGAFYEIERSFTLEEMFSANHIFTIAVYSRELFDRVGGIRPDVYCEDLDFWFHAFVFAHATHIYTPQVLALYTISDTQMTADVPRICASRIRIYSDLIDSGALTPEQVELAHGAIEKTRQDEWVWRRRTAVKRAVARVAGPRAGEAASKLMHATGKLLRPAVARLASMLMARRERG